MPRSPEPDAAPKSIRAAVVKRKPAPRKPRGSAAVITLPKTPEPLIAPTLPPTPPPPRAADQRPAASQHPAASTARAVALYRPPGLLGQLAGWLTRQGAALRPAAKPSRAADELARLRTDNQRLRDRIELLETRLADSVRFKKLPRGAPKRLLQPQS